ncbi:MAG: hypothetical protein M1814_003775 [Vezdaea aestivalis]|nr:MAG: hypothetical protein M1814_003775 [Vezdaea aestivalis]
MSHNLVQLLRRAYRLGNTVFSASTLGFLLRQTALNPLFTFIILLLARYTRKGQSLSLENEPTLKKIRALLYFSLVRLLNNYLSQNSLNNWQSDSYVWSQELVVVTGGSDGIGACTSKLLASRGIKVVVLDVQPLKYPRPANLTYIHCDVGCLSSIADAASQIRSTLGNPTVLVNNAGIFVGKPILDATEAEISKTFNVNTLGSFWLTRQFLPDMVANNHGMIVVTTSLAAHVTAAKMVDYGASKAAAAAFHDGLATELKCHYNASKVRTMLITPGLINTALAAGIKAGTSALTHATEPEVLAQVIVERILTGKSNYLTFPAFNTIFCSMKGWPSWLKVYMGQEGSKAMEDFKGREVRPDAACQSHNRALLLHGQGDSAG